MNDSIFIHFVAFNVNFYIDDFLSFIIFSLVEKLTLRAQTSFFRLS